MLSKFPKQPLNINQYIKKAMRFIWTMMTIREILI